MACEVVVRVSVLAQGVAGLFFVLLTAPAAS